MLVNIYVLRLILKKKITTIILLLKTDFNWSQMVHMDRSFYGLDSQNSKDWSLKRCGKWWTQDLGGNKGGGCASGLRLGWACELLGTGPSSGTSGVS